MVERLKNLDEKLNEAIQSTVWTKGIWSFPAESCSVDCGFVKTPDGRTAQVTITVQTDKDEWINLDK